MSDGTAAAPKAAMSGRPQARMAPDLRRSMGTLQSDADYHEWTARSDDSIALTNRVPRQRAWPLSQPLQDRVHGDYK